MSTPRLGLSVCFVTRVRSDGARLVGDSSGLMWLSCWAFRHIQCCRTWTKGNNEDFLGRVAKYGQRHKWAALIKAFHAAAFKVRVLSAVPFLSRH